MANLVTSLSRRNVLAGTAALGLAATLGRPSWAQESGPVKLGALLPLSGGLAQFGPECAETQRAVVKAVNDSGGLLGAPVEYFAEDDANVPDTGLLATRKMIGANGVAAVMSVFNSAVAAATLPVCWESKVMMLALASSDSLVELPHQGFFVRTQPHTELQGQELGRLALTEGAKKVFMLVPQQPFSINLKAGIRKVLESQGVAMSDLTYDAKKTSFRSEVDAVMAFGPDVLIIGGYPPEHIIIAKELYRASYAGKVLLLSAGLTPAVIEGAGAEVTEGFMTVTPIPDAQSSAFADLSKLIGVESPSNFTCQAYDHINLALLSIARAKVSSGTAIRDNIRAIGDANGVPVGNAIDGIKALAEGKEINYLGASGPCKFEPNGNVSVSKFQTKIVKDGKIVPKA